MMAKTVTTSDLGSTEDAANSKMAVYLRGQIDSLINAGIKTQKDIAKEMGYPKGNIISMFKTGEVRVPLDKIPALAKAINVDVAFLFRLAMEQYWPKRNDAIAAVFGTITTSNQRDILAKIQELTGEEDPALTPELEAKLRKVFLKAF